jgi:hypothetical protein
MWSKASYKMKILGYFNLLGPIVVGVENPHKFWMCRQLRNVRQTSRQISTTASSGSGVMRLPAHSTNAYCDGTIIYNDPVVSGVFFWISPQNRRWRVVNALYGLRISCLNLILIRHSRSFWDRVGLVAMIFSFHVGLTDSVMQRIQFFFLSVSVRHFYCHRIARFIILIFVKLVWHGTKFSQKFTGKFSVKFRTVSHCLRK